MKTVIFFLLFLTQVVWCQEQVFTVLTSKGDVQVKRLNNSWQPLSIGVILYKGETIKLNKNNYLGLLHSTGKTKELKNEGTYNVADIAGSFDSQKATVSSKFAGYLLQEFMNKDDTKKEMENLGAVVRQGVERIELDFPGNTLIIDSTIQFSWFPNQSGESYIFQIMNNAKNTVFMQEVKEPFIAVNANALQLEKGKPYQWKVFSTTNDDMLSDTAVLELLPSRERQTFQAEFSQLLKELNYDETALNYLIIAKYYEQNKLNANALKYYEKSIAAAPEVDDYFFAYINFLQSNGMNSKAGMLIKQKQLSEMN
ncbi:MAG: hypothetical protein COW85_08765 [Ignavibacteria bacterium CG22_combo_CG10-13_8_21_14_all_37_15]|nr:MAG: hypothetical protein COW85_08765 [Ignavibacteria bacterium CG22_combo_CG10-13_8_21_14_all_37_15]